MFDTRKLLRGSAHALAPEQRSRFERSLSLGPRLTQSPRTAPGALTLSRPNEPAEREADAVASRGPTGAATERGVPSRAVDLGAVRIHSDETAARAARSVNADAFTLGHDVFFGRGRYEPGTPRGDELILHELAHVAQQASAAPPNGGLALQRREGKYPGEPDSATYSVLKPKKLNPKGPYSAAVLNLISWTHTDSSATGGRSNAELIVTILESSPTFVAMAKALDQHYSDDSNPSFWVGLEFRGSMFVPKGQPYPTRSAGSVEATAVASNDFIHIDPSARPKISYADLTSGVGADEQRAVAFADVLIHETIHAYRNAKGLGKGGLEGSLKEELETRLGTQKVLGEIEKATKNKDVASETHAAIDAVKDSGVTLLDVAQSLVSGDGVTYLEKFYLEQAMSTFLSHYAPGSTDVAGALARLDPTSATLKRMPAIRAEFSKLLVELSTPKPPPPAPAPAPPVTTTPGAQTPPTKTPPPQAPPAKKTPPAWLLGASDKKKLEALMTDTLTLADLRTAEKAARKLKGDEERALFYYVLLVRLRELTVTLADEHDKATATRGTKAYSKFCTELAARLLGIKKAYSGL